MSTGTMGSPTITRRVVRREALHAASRVPSRARRIASWIGVLVVAILAGRAFVWHRP
jgi:hypothetical protein